MVTLMKISMMKSMKKIVMKKKMNPTTAMKTMKSMIVTITSIVFMVIPPPFYCN